MFKNRAFQVKMVKDDKEELSKRNQIELFEDKVAIIHANVLETVMSITLLGLLYIAADTIRQVIVEQAKK